MDKHETQEQVQALYSCVANLNKAFLQRLLLYRLGQKLEMFVGKDDNMEQIAFAVIERAAQYGWLDDFIHELKEELPAHRNIQSLPETIEYPFIETSSPYRNHTKETVKHPALNAYIFMIGFLGACIIVIVFFVIRANTVQIKPSSGLTESDNLLESSEPDDEIATISLLNSSEDVSQADLADVLESESLYFEPEKPNESLIIVVPFLDKDDLGSSPEARIVRNLLQENAKSPDGFSKTRVESYPNVISSRSIARQMGKDYKATVVVWGWYDQSGIQSFAEILKRTPVQTMFGDELPVAPLAQDQYRFCLKEGAPIHATYLSLFALGLSSFYAANFEQAIEYFDVAIELPESELCATNSLEAILYRGRAYLLTGDRENAEVDIEYVLNEDDTSVEAYLWRGIIHFEQTMLGRPFGNFGVAMDDFNKIIELDSGHSEAHYYRGRLYASALAAKYNQLYFDNAISDFTKSIELDSTNPRPYLQRGQLSQNIDDLQASIVLYEQLIDLESNTCWLLSEAGVANTTLQLLQSFEAANCNWYIAPNGLISSVCKGSNVLDLTETLTLHTRAIELCPDAPLPYAHRGTVYLLLEDCVSARKDLEQAIAIASEGFIQEQMETIRDTNLTDCIAD